jgi:hypothetical protein
MSSEKELKQLEHRKRKDIINKVLTFLSDSDESLYYMPTVEIAAAIQETIAEATLLLAEEREIVKNLTVRDIQVLLSHHDRPGRI